MMVTWFDGFGREDLRFLSVIVFLMLHWMMFDDQKKGLSMVIDQPRVIECSKTRV